MYTMKRIMHIVRVARRKIILKKDLTTLIHDSFPKNSLRRVITVKAMNRIFAYEKN